MIDKNILKHKPEIILFILYFLILLLLRILFPISHVLSFNGKELDEEFYYLMAEDLTRIFKGEILIPFCWRILIPFLVYLLPFNIIFSFGIITLISFYLFGIMLFFTLRLHFSRNYSILGFIFLCIIMFTMEDFINFHFVRGYCIDPLLYLLYICSFYAIIKQNKILFAILLFLGVLTKESFFFVVPVFFICNYFNEKEKNSNQQILYTIFKNLKYIIPALLIFLIIHYIAVPLPTSENEYWTEVIYKGYDYLSLGYIGTMIQIRMHTFLRTINLLTFETWSICWIFCFFNNKDEIIKWIQIYGIFIICVYVQIILAWGRSRLIFIASYPILFLSILGTKRIIEYIFKYPRQQEFKFYKPLELKISNFPMIDFK